MTTNRVAADRLLSEFKPGAYAYLVVGLCVMVAMAEGYDAQAMAFAAPVIAQEWGLTPSVMSVLLAASIVGLVIGSFLLAPLGDRWGRRPAVLLGLLIASAATGAGAIAPDVPSLLATRLVAGLGLGLAFPTLIALAMEVMPRRLHTLTVVLVGCGYPLGGVFGGAAVAQTLPLYGYQSVFVLGAVSTLAFLLICLVLLPESPLFLARRDGGDARLPRLLSRLGGSVPPGTVQFFIEESRPERSPVRELFTPERKQPTLLLWTMNFANLLIVYYMITWLPTIMVNAGRDAAFGALVHSMYGGAGIVGGLALALLMRRFGAGYTLGGAYAATAVSAAALGLLDRVDALFLSILAFSGAMIVGSQFCLNAVVNQFYPSAMRATAAGYATGAGRLGAVAAPAVGGVVFSISTSPSLAFYVLVVPAVAAVIAIAAFQRITGGRPTSAARQPLQT
jgi:AAHS family 4-hydroxybenzoate transporter-like MFS transporter